MNFLIDLDPTHTRCHSPYPTIGGRRLEMSWRVLSVHVPVQCRVTDVAPGDFLFADEDGVAASPRARFVEVIAAARKWQADKQALLPLIEKHGSYLKAVQERGAARRQ